MTLCLGWLKPARAEASRYLPYEFAPAVRLSLMVALALDPGVFRSFSTLRIHLETSFWEEAVALLTDEDEVGFHEFGGAGQGQVEQSSAPKFPTPNTEHSTWASSAGWRTRSCSACWKPIGTLTTRCEN